MTNEYVAAGFLCYEAGAAFGLRTVGGRTPLPFAWFACMPLERVRRGPLTRSTAAYSLGPLRPEWSREEFARAFDAVKAHLAAGDSYQVNLTFGLKGEFSGDPVALFADLVENQQGAYAAYIHAGSWTACSGSPELYFSLEDGQITARPMKGTAPRGRTVNEDDEQRDALRASEKQRAENVMVVDMMRSDIGRIAEWGSVDVPQLFTVERYPTVWQMTSTVTARTSEKLSTIFAALHPSASITGAPKVRTMEILASLETRPRGLYTGAIGYIAPDGFARFSVAIRTAVIDHGSRTLDFGIGSGIVWDSDAGQEYDECLLKARVLAKPRSDFELLETMRWSPDSGYLLLERHLDRMSASAGYFGYQFDRDRAAEALAARAETWAGLPGERRVRLMVARDGLVTLEETPFEPTRGALRLAVAGAPVDSSDIFLFHKTTRRDVYNRARMDGFDDVVLWNERGEITETTTCNIVVDTERGRVTPPVGCGLLGGTFRQEAIDRGELREEAVTVDALRRIGWCWLVNSVHGWRRAELEST